MITPFDWAIWGLYLVCISICLWFIRERKSKELQKYYLIGFFVKVFGGVAFTLIYIFHYNGIGDTFLYFNGAKVLADAFLESPLDYLRLLAAPAGNIPPELTEYTDQVFYAATSEEWFMVKILSPFVLFGFKSYLVTTLLVSIVAFYGSWKLYLVFNDTLIGRKQLAFAIAFLIPSTVFWGSGIVKDTITMVGINVIIYALYFGFRKKANFKLLIGSLIWAYIILGLKAYIILSFLPSLIIIVHFFFISRTTNKSARLFLTPVLILFLGAIAFVSYQNLTSISEKYNQENIKKKLLGFHTWHATIGESSYSLGEIDYTPLGVASKIPIALATTFFRPFVWQASNPVILLSAIESLLILVLFLTVSFKTRLFYFRYLKSRFFTSMLVFVLLFGFVVGFTSYNFGALSRYKIPIIPLFVFIQFYILQSVKNKKSVLRN